MNAALWGFLGTIVGAASVFGATVWQQRVSHKHERESRRRDSQIQVLTELLDAAVNLIKCEDSVNKDRRQTGEKIQSVKPSSEVVAARFEVMKLTTLVLDGGVLRGKVEDVIEVLRAINETEDPEVFRQRSQEAAQHHGLLLTEIGEQLRALY